MSQAAQQVHDGDYASAIENYQAVLDGLGSSSQKEVASIELALTQWRSGNAQDAIDRFQQFVEQYPKSDRVADAWFGLGEAYFDQQAGTKRSRLIKNISTYAAM